MAATEVLVVPSTVVNDKDCGALVTIATAFCITLSLLILGTRMLSRWPWGTLFGYDDLVASFASVR